jgi:hypothetical protein
MSMQGSIFHTGGNLPIFERVRTAQHQSNRQSARRSLAHGQSGFRISAQHHRELTNKINAYNDQTPIPAQVFSTHDIDS